MAKKYIIKDLQCPGQFSHHTSVNGIFDDCVDDYMSNDWADKEAADLLQEFDSYNQDEKIQFVAVTYEYEFVEDPSAELIQEWEDFTGKNWLKKNF